MHVCPSMQTHTIFETNVYRSSNFQEQYDILRTHEMSAQLWSGHTMVHALATTCHTGALYQHIVCNDDTCSQVAYGVLLLHDHFGGLCNGFCYA